MKNNWKTYGLHVIGWLIILLISTIVPLKKGVRFDELWTSTHEWKNLLSWIFLIVFAYINHIWFVPLFYQPKKYMKYGIILVLSLGVILFLPEVLNFMESRPPGPIQDPIPPKPPIIMELSHVVLLFVVIGLVSISFHSEIQLQKTEKQRLETELTQLKLQIQPHFLFNTLNSIYALAIRKDDKTAKTVVQLSEFLRYVIRETSNHLVPLEKEIAYLENYLDLQRSRLRDSVEVDFQVVGNPGELQILPLLLFSFIENAFKHGVSPEEDSQIEIRIDITDPEIKLMVRNKKVLTNARVPSSGIGMENTQKRLTLYYPAQHHLTIINGDKDYQVELNIKLK